MDKKKAPTVQRQIVTTELIEERIFIIRGQKVMVDADLADVYGVSTKVLNQAVKRNLDRFPEDFMFQLTQEEAEMMRSQIVTASKRNIRYLPRVFTEHGAVMLASVINSSVAVEASIQVVRAFVRLRSILAEHKELAKKLDELEKKHDNQAQKTEAQYKTVLELIKRIIKGQTPAQQARRKIGFKTDKEK